MGSSSSSLPAQSHGSAVRALQRILETMIPDRAKHTRALTHALSSAGLRELPESFDELLGFVRLHLARYLADPDRPQLIGAILEDFEAEAEHARLGADPNSSSRMAVATRVPAPRLLADLVASHLHPEPEPESERIHAAPQAPHKNVAFRERPAVLVIERDRFKRAALARTLVQACCDVTVLESADDAIEFFHAREPLDLLVIDVDAQGAEAIVSALVGARPGVPVLAWTGAAPTVAEHVARILGVRACETVPRNALGAEIHEAVHRLLDQR